MKVVSLRFSGPCHPFNISFLGHQIDIFFWGGGPGFCIYLSVIPNLGKEKIDFIFESFNLDESK